MYCCLPEWRINILYYSYDIALLSHNIMMLFYINDISRTLHIDLPTKIGEMLKM